MNLSDTIVAIASPPGASARGLVRVSGPDAWRVVRSVSHAKCQPLERRRGLRTHRLSNGWPCLLLLFPGPRSYTGEDTIEIALPGNPTLLARAVSLLIDAGARHAEAGEFTARAWLNGRLTLTQAEGVAALISAASDAQLRAAHMLSGNKLGQVSADLCERLAGALALVEAGIDFTEEEDVVAIAPSDLAARLAFIIEAINETLESAVGSQSLSALPRVVLVGPPNAGKSTLYNALLGRHRAVVSETRGTTRDVLVEPMHLDPDDPLSPEVLLVDMAGLDESPLGLNPLMQAAARQAIEGADLLLEVDSLEQGVAGGATSFEAAARGSDQPRLRVRSKADLHESDAEPHAEGSELIHLSAVSGAGLSELRQRIGELLADRVGSLGADSLALLPRHERCLREARDDLAKAAAIVNPPIADGAPSSTRPLSHPELVAASMRSALDALGSLAGTVSPDDVLGRIFAGFCIGK